MSKKRLLEMSEELESKIVELAHAIKKIGLENASFEYYGIKSCGVYRVYITEYKESWEVVHMSEGYANVPAKRDMYEMKFGEKKLTYKYSEED